MLGIGLYHYGGWKSQAADELETQQSYWVVLV